MAFKKKKFTAVISIMILAAVVAFGLYYSLSIYRGLEGLKKTSEDSPFAQVMASEENVAEPPKWAGEEPVNILLMGVDARGNKKNEIPRSDSMMVVSLDPVKKRIHVFSILRDTYTDIPEHGKNRINTAVTHGPKTAMRAVSELLGIPVQFYVYTDFQGFIKLVDAVGGVDFYVEKDMTYESKADHHEYDINLKEGEQHLDGKTALQYVRFRHDALSDYSRTKRQRDFANAIVEKMKSTTSIMKLPSILQEVSPYIDTNLSVNDMWQLASVGYKSKMEASEQIPPMKLLKETYVGRAAVLGVTNDNELKDYVRNILEADEFETTETGNSPLDHERESGEVGE
ncbi:LCP family protein [Paenibacillus hubeiensis]|uniref:LCP family protein n=1 Tax=Paenibacillus hubeiensis TaxID=3077330 RepID=UPI0031B9E9FC